MKHFEKDIQIFFRYKDESLRRSKDSYVVANLPAKGDYKGNRWTFNGDFEKPTIRNSVLGTRNHRQPDGTYKEIKHHFFLTNGVIDNCEDGVVVEFIKIEQDED